jgi:hypothetical protein
MLYDRKWDKQTPWTLSHLIGWLESNDPSESYNYGDTCGCLLAQYAKTVEPAFKAMHSTSYVTADGDTHDLPAGFNDIAVGIWGEDDKRTFGAALVRARAYETSLVDA